MSKQKNRKGSQANARPVSHNDDFCLLIWAQFLRALSSRPVGSAGWLTQIAQASICSSHLRGAKQKSRSQPSSLELSRGAKQKGTTVAGSCLHLSSLVHALTPRRAAAACQHLLSAGTPAGGCGHDQDPQRCHTRPLRQH